MDKMLEKNVIGWKEGDYSVLTLETFFVSVFAPAVRLVREAYGDVNLYDESACRWYAGYVDSTRTYIVARTATFRSGFFQVCPDLRPMKFSTEELLQDLATGLACFVQEAEAILHGDESPKLREHLAAIREFIPIIPSLKIE